MHKFFNSCVNIYIYSAFVGLDNKQKRALNFHKIPGVSWPSYEYLVLKRKFVPQHMQGISNRNLQYKIPQSVTLLSAYRIPALVWALGIHMRFLLNKAVPLSRERCKDAAGETFFIFLPVQTGSGALPASCVMGGRKSLPRACS